MHHADTTPVVMRLQSLNGWVLSAMKRFFSPGPALYAALLVVTAMPVVAQDAPAPWVTRFSGRTVVGDGVGHDDGFSSVDWFLPLSAEDDSTMWFGDFRALVFPHTEIGGNAGMGYRWYNFDQNRIYGINGYWDVRRKEGLLWNQAGIGFESLGEIMDFRVNGYTPAVNDTTQHLNHRFVGNNLLLREYNALTGIDYEAAANLPDFGDIQSKIAGGGYYFDSTHTEAAAGWRARIEVAFRDTVAASFAVQDDDLFGSTFNVGIEIRRAIRHFESPSHRSMDHKFRNDRGTGDGQTILHRLADPVYRQQNIVLHKTVGFATDTAGVPLTFVHVVEGGAGDGTFETPYGTISDAMLDPLAPTSIVYTPTGGTFTEDVTMVAGTRLLSNGPVQVVTTSTGDIVLPFSGSGRDLDVLPASIVGNVTLADNTELSGFDITGGVSGIGLTDVNINNSVIGSAPADGLSFMGTDAITIDTVSITNPTGRGLLLDDSSATITDLRISNAGDDAIEIITAATDRTISLTDLTVTSATLQGLDVNVAGAGDLTLALSGGDINATGNAIDIATTAAGDALVSIDSTTVASDTGAGINADGSGGAGTLFITSFANNTVTAAGAGGVLLNTVTQDSDPATVGNQQVVSTSLTIGSTANRVDGVGLSLVDVTGDWDAGTVGIFNSGATGLFVDNTGLGTPVVLSTSAGSVLNTATGPAIELDTVTADLNFTSITSTNSATLAAGFTNVTGSITSVTTTLSGSVAPSLLYDTIALPDVFTANLGATTINSTISDVEADNIDKLGDVSGLTEIYTPLTINGP
jgi:hypothetical protein